MSEGLLRMIYDKVTSIEGILRASSLGKEARAAYARADAKDAAKVAAKSERAIRELEKSALKVGSPDKIGEINMLDGELRFVSNGNVYEFDALTEEVGDFLGRLKADETIDRTATELSGGARKTRNRKNKRRSAKNKKRRSQKH